MNDAEHVPVLLAEALQAINIRPDGIYVDATYGRGGHSRVILERLGPTGRLVALDRDPEAVKAAREQVGDDARFEIIKGPFSMLGHHIESRGLTGRVNGILFDLGVSSPQLEDPKRGFSFRHEGPLDMRMDPETGITAAEWIKRATEGEIARVIREFGEERYARRIARAIARQRRDKPIATTRELAELVARAVPTREAGQDPATRTFQAIRMHVNQELEELRRALPQAVRALAPGGRLVVISFHSLEDRLVKRFMGTESRGGDMPPELPVRAAELRSRLRTIGKAVRPSADQVARNPRARSARLRIAERTDVPYD